jgi:hypothetical protein
MLTGSFRHHGFGVSSVLQAKAMISGLSFELESQDANQTSQNESWEISWRLSLATIHLRGNSHGLRIAGDWSHRSIQTNQSDLPLHEFIPRSRVASDFVE